jgi:hypothetical protein
MRMFRPLQVPDRVNLSSIYQFIASQLLALWWYPFVLFCFVVFLFLFLCSAGDWTKGIAHARQHFPTELHLQLDCTKSFKPESCTSLSQGIRLGFASRGYWRRAGRHRKKRASLFSGSHGCFFFLSWLHYLQDVRCSVKNTQQEVFYISSNHQYLNRLQFIWL